MLIYNFNFDSEDTLVPMYSEYGDTGLALLSVTHRAGTALKRFIASQPDEVRDAGGPWIEFDGLPPDGLLSVEELRQMLLSALGLFFMLISFSGCILIVAGTYGHVQVEGNRIVFSAVDGGGDGAAAAAPHRRGNNALLTAAQVRTLAASTKEEEEEEVGKRESGAADVGGKAVSRHCAVCIDDLDEGDSVTTLPCGHQFHTDCVLPWLTERQSKCPLCKFDVYEHVRQRELEEIRLRRLQRRRRRRRKRGGSESGGDSSDEEEDDDEIRGKAPSWLDRVLRYRWTTVATTSSGGGPEARTIRRRRETVASGAAEGGERLPPSLLLPSSAAPGGELELTEQR